MEILRTENSFSDKEVDSETSPVDGRQVEALIGLIEVYKRLKLSLKDVAPRWSTEMQEQMQAAGMDLPLGSEQLNLLRQFHSVFRIVQATPGGCNMGDVSEQLGIPLSNATRVIEQMVQRKLLERRSSAEDRRIILIQVTPSGEQVYHAFDEAFRQRLEQLLGQFTPEERQQLLHLGHRLFELWSTSIREHHELE
ncbi:MarR family winged helix-turn-helix transcriptional regulator [Deinococcus altitudinis]|uniref:MarR family winged helix-turn-helix transcriptional regulator n=1 Tax=Deinococcus altitudinis TaxID=468914 RepID=UPI0038924BEA